MNDLRGRVALITGASGGVARVMARRYSVHGVKVALVTSEPDEVASTANAIAEEGGTSMTLVADVRDERQCAQVVAETVEKWGRLDVLINKAAITGSNQEVAEATAANWHDVLATNLIAPMLLSREALRQSMVPNQSGNIQFISSTAAFNVEPSRAHYAASMMGLTGLGQTLALEVGSLGIRVNTLVVGCVAGVPFDSYVAKRAVACGLNAADVRHRMIERNKIGRLLQPDEVAEVSMWLASDAASAITGQTIDVTGG